MCGKYLGTNTLNSGIAAQVGGNYTMTAPNPGVVAFGTGSQTNGAAGVTMGPLAFLLGGGSVDWECCCGLQALSDAAQEYDFRAGLGDEGTADFTDGVYFEYDRNVSPNWLICAANNGTRTKTASSIAVSANFTRLGIDINTGATSAEFFVNGVSAGTVTTNIPTASGRPLAIFATNIVKSAGTTSRYAYVDYIDIRQTLTTAR